MAKRSASGLPLIEKKKDDCPAGGEHEDLPYVRVLNLEGSPDELVEFFCLKCHLCHWAVFPQDRKKIEPSVIETHDDNAILDGLPHA